MEGVVSLQERSRRVGGGAYEGDTKRVARCGNDGWWCMMVSDDEVWY